MLKEDLQNGIVVKTREGDFKLLKDNHLIDLKEDDVIVRQDDIIPHTPVEITKPGSTQAGFYFSIDDEEEVKKITEAPVVDGNRAISQFIEKLAVQIVEQSGVDGEEMRTRNLRNIIISRFRNVRGLADTREALIKAVELGGVGLDQEAQSKVISLIEIERRKVEEAILSGGKGLLVEEDKKQVLPVKAEPAKVEKKSVVHDEHRNLYKEERDIFSHQSTGAVEEIQGLTLEYFRKMGKNPDEATDRILQKINLLEDESVSKKAEGIEAWKKSGTYRVYLTLGATSMAEGKTVSDVIDKYKEEGKPYLTKEEFDVIADLNRKLAY